MNILVIVESFTKEKTVKKYLESLFDKKYNIVVKASGGHICDIEKRGFGIDKDTYMPIYTLLEDKKKNITDLRACVKRSDMVYLASDNDREGEAIAWNILETMRPKRYKRIVFNEITKSALETAISNPKEIDMHMVRAQQARRVLDRLVGFNITQVLWKSFTGGSLLSAGRVQSVVLKLIVEKEAQVSSFESERYWNVSNTFDNNIVDAKLCHNDTIYKFGSEKKLIELMRLLKRQNQYTISDHKESIVNEYPDKPFTTSTLQQKAHSRGISIKETMRIAQDLYEKGHITYMRTDSAALSEEFVSKARPFIAQEYGAGCLAGNSGGNRKGTKKQVNAQEAHEAIRPTKLKRIDARNGKHKILYDMIFNQTIASLMAPAKYKELTVVIQHSSLKSSGMYFRGKAKILVELGYLVVYKSDDDAGKLAVKKDFKVSLQNSTLRSKELVGHCVWSTPPPRYNESSIIKKMEESGIGRPSTYVSIMNKLYDRHFIDKRDMVGPIKEYTHYVVRESQEQIESKTEQKHLYDERSKLVPINAGEMVNEFIQKHYSDIIDVQFTSDMESSLDDIAKGKQTYQNLIPNFYRHIVSKSDKLKARVQSKGDKSVIKDDAVNMTVNGTPVVIRNAKYGPVIQTKGAPGEKDSFVGLKPFFKTYGISDISLFTQEQCRFLLQFPVRYGHYQIHYKSYGFYVQNTKTDETISIKRRDHVDQLMNRNFEFINSLKKTPYTPTSNRKKTGQ